MKLVIFGLTISSSWGNGHATLWRGLCSALANRGHQIVFFERDVPYYAGARDFTEMSYGELVLYANWENVEEKAREHVRSADVTIVTSYCPDAQTAGELSGRGLRVFYDLDAPVTLGRISAGDSVDYVGVRGYRDYDLVLSYTGGRALEQLQTILGSKRVAPLYGSVDPAVHKPAAPQERFRSALSYMGTWSSDRDSALSMRFIEPARQLPHERFVIGGSQYGGDFPWLENIYFVRHVAAAEHPAFYCSSRLTLNVTRGPMAAMGYCPSGRLFEAAACGVPILSDDWEGLDTFYQPGSEILIANSTSEAVDAIQLAPLELSRIGRMARERTLDCHTAGVRALELEKILEQASSKSAAPAEVACGA